jgi:hypothetical protein
MLMDMGYDLVNRDKMELHINAGASQFLTKLTAGWWTLIGLPPHMDERECLWMARVLRNYAGLQIRMDDDTRSMIKWDKECKENIDWYYEAADFFSKSALLTGTWRKD